MKTTYTFTKLFLLVAILFAAVSCSENEKEVVVEPEFPEEEVVSSVTPNGETILTFSANMNWEVTSSAIWCKFANGSTSMKGEAGDISLSLTITEDAWSVEESVVEITLKMGGEEKVIAKYTRAGKTPVITNADGEEYGEENPIVLTYTNNGVSGSFNFVANYDWEIKDENLPEWLKISENNSQMGGNAGESVLVTFEVAKNFWANAQDGNVVIKAKNSDVSVSIPVSFNGIPEGVIAIDGINGTAFWWKISADGKNFWKDGAESEKLMFPLSFNAIAKDNAYTVVKIEEDGGFMWVNDEPHSFLSLEDDNAGNVVLTAQENTTGKERLAYILVMPQKVFDEIKEKADANGGSYDNILLNSEGKDLIESEYDSYVVLAFKQEGASAAGGFKVLKGEWEPIACSSDMTSELSQFIAGKYGITPESIYSLSVSSNAYLTVCPLLAEWSYKYMGFTMTGTNIDNMIEPGESEGIPAVNFSATETMYVVFINNGAPVKALIINVE